MKANVFSLLFILTSFIANAQADVEMADQFRADGKIYAATYGRGVWASPKVPNILNSSSFLSANDVFLYPNPTKDKITLSFNKGIEADFSVFNLLGQNVATLVNGVESAGYHTVQFDASRLSSGIYLYRLETSSSTIIKQMVLIK